MSAPLSAHQMSARSSEYGDGEEEWEENPEEEEEEYYPDDEQGVDNSVHGLNLRWALGFNYKLINGVINLTRTEGDYSGGSNGKPKEEIFFVVGHTGVIYNYGENKKQRLLQGHCNAITSVAYSHNKRIIITADKGPSSLLVIWDVNSATPRKCIFDPHPNGVECLDVSEDGRTIITLSREEMDKETKKYYSQSVCVWEWEREGNPCVSTGILQAESSTDFIYYQNYVQMNYNKPEEFVTTGRERVFFWKIDYDGVCSYYSPQTSNESSNPSKKNKKKKKEKSNSKHFTQTVFIPNSTQAVSGTEEGSLVVWDISLIMEEMSQPDQKREIKTIKLMNDSTMGDSGDVGISVLKASKVLLIVGATNGNVRFYDYQFRIVGWFEEEAGLAKVTSISLSNVHFHYEQVLKKLEKDEHNFDYPDFIVVDNQAKIVKMRAEQFNGVTDDEKKGETLIQSIVSSVVGISAHPNSQMLAIACSDGNIIEWNYMLKDKEMKIIHNLKEPEKGVSSNEEPTCLKYSPNGHFLVVTSNAKYVHFYNVKVPESKKTKQAISQKKEHIHGVDIAFSHDSLSMAIMDDHSCVTLFKYDGDPQNFNDNDWSFCGKLKGHFSEINSLCFGEVFDQTTNSKISKVFSVGNDKYLFQYDVKNSKNKLDVTSFSKIETEARPTACLWYPVNYLKEDMIMIATDDYKIKLWNVANNICRQTLLGPTYGGPINRMIYLNIYPKKDRKNPKYVAYTTAEKIVGIIRLPLDGNPNKTMGMIAHPDKISYATASSDGKFLFTSGADEIGTVNMWSLNYSVLDEAGIDLEEEQNPLDTYPNLLEGGKDGQIYRDLKDFFYYAQISSNTQNPTKAKKLDGKIPMEEAHNLMRALGYYPTNAEIKNIQNEIYYSKYLETGEGVDNLKLETFVRLFINHRPVYGLTMDQIKQKMSVLAQKELENEDQDKINELDERTREEIISKGVLPRSRFVDLLTNHGEKMDEEELNKALKVLLGEGDPDLILPENIDSKFLIEKLLGFELDETQDYEDEIAGTGEDMESMAQMSSQNS